MKQIILTTAIAVTVLGTVACNNQPSEHEAGHNHEDHAHDGAAKAAPAQPGNEMQRIMDDMMTKMHGMKPSGNSDRDFAAMMISHHQGAIDMARAELNTGKNPQIRKMAEGIIAAQEAEIADMQGIMASLPQNGKPDSAAFDALMGSMGSMMAPGAAPTGKPDRDFVQAMIPHHEGAVEMAKVQLQYGRDAKLKAMAQKIIADQTREIAQMNEWLATNP